MPISEIKCPISSDNFINTANKRKNGMKEKIKQSCILINDVFFFGADLIAD